MKLSRTVAYAIQATLQLAQADSPRPIPCSQLANQGSMPERFLLQILRSLVTHGILTSTRGVEGGYSLVKAPTDISVLEVIEAIDGPLGSSIPLGDGISQDSQTRLKQALEQVTVSSRNQLNSIKLSHLITPAVKTEASINGASF